MQLNIKSNANQRFYYGSLTSLEINKELTETIWDVPSFPNAIQQLEIFHEIV